MGGTDATEDAPIRAGETPDYAGWLRDLEMVRRVSNHSGLWTDRLEAAALELDRLAAALTALRAENAALVADNARLMGMLEGEA